MPRVKTILQSEYPYNISARCINREWFSIPMNRVWNIFCEELTNTVEKHNLKVHSFVLMTNHFHLIATTPHANISQCMYHFMKNSSHRLTEAGNRINQTYAGRYYKCVLQSHTYYLNAYKYNYRNPVEAGICRAVQDYEFSTLPSVMGLAKSIIPIAPDLTFECDPKGTLEWLNRAPEKMQIEAARYGFTRQFFISKKCPKTRRPILGKYDTL